MTEDPFELRLLQYAEDRLESQRQLLIDAMQFTHPLPDYLDALVGVIDRSDMDADVTLPVEKALAEVHLEVLVLCAVARREVVGTTLYDEVLVNNPPLKSNDVANAHYWLCKAVDKARLNISDDLLLPEAGISRGQTEGGLPSGGQRPQTDELAQGQDLARSLEKRWDDLSKTATGDVGLLEFHREVTAAIQDNAALQEERIEQNKQSANEQTRSAPAGEWLYSDKTVQDHKRLGRLVVRLSSVASAGATGLLSLPILTSAISGWALVAGVVVVSGGGALGGGVVSKRVVANYELKPQSPTAADLQKERSRRLGIVLDDLKDTRWALTRVESAVAMEIIERFESELPSDQFFNEYRPWLHTLIGAEPTLRGRAMHDRLVVDCLVARFEHPGTEQDFSLPNDLATKVRQYASLNQIGPGPVQGLGRNP